MEKLKGQSLDLEKHSIEKIKELFPEVVTEGKIDFERLRHILGDEVDESNEKYQFTWNGKSQTIKLAQKPSNGTLRPSKTESKDWDTTENLYIEGDNLEVLKQLQKTYFGKIKMIYIDPPYNTGGDFVYKDDFKDSIKNYKEQTNQTNRSNADTSGRYHTDWLNMMYSRLMISKNILSDEGVVFISIDDNEIENLLKIGKEVLGESNHIGTIIRVSKTTSFRGNYLAPSKDYVVVFAKNTSYLKPFVDEVTNGSQFNKVEIEGQMKGEMYRDDIAFYLSTLETRPNQRYFIECPDGELVLPPGKTFPPDKPTDGDGVWRWNKDSFEKKKNYIVFKKSTRSPLINDKGEQASWNIYTKSYFSEKVGNIPRDFLAGLLNRNGSNDLKKLSIQFSFPKPVKLVEYLMKISSQDKDVIVLDFFSGSATTAHAVMKLNAEDGGNRKFIMVQLPEKTEENSEAYKAGYINICEIGKERIRRAGEQIKQDIEKEGKDSSNLDIGFKVFKLDDTNIKEWDSSLEVSESTLFDQKEAFKEARTEEDVLYEILLKYGVFDMPVHEINVLHKKAYDIGQGDMVVALFDDITAEDVRAIGDLKPRVVIFKDSGFKDDNVKLNALHNLQRQGVEDVKSI